jgi:hypothetical protein
MSSERRSELVISLVALALGVSGLIVARDLPLTAYRGVLVLRLGPSFNPLGAGVVIALAVLAIGGALLGRRALVLASSGGFALVAVQVLLQFGRTPNWLGTRGSNLALALGMAAGLGAPALAERGRNPEI